MFPRETCRLSRADTTADHLHNFGIVLAKMLRITNFARTTPPLLKHFFQLRNAASTANFLTIDATPPLIFKFQPKLPNPNDNKTPCSPEIFSSSEDAENALENNDIIIDSQSLENILENNKYRLEFLLGIFQHATQNQGFIPSSRACNLLINSMSKYREFDLTWMLINEMKEHGLLNLDTFVILFRRYARAGMNNAALRSFDLMEHFGITRNLEALTAFMKALCKEKKIQFASLVFSMRKDRFGSNTEMYNSLINGWCRIHGIKKAEVVFGQMVVSGIAPDVVTFASLVKGYCSAKRLEDAIHLLKSMKTKGCQPNALVFNPLVDSLGEAGRIFEAHLMLDEMAIAGCQPNISTFNSLIKACCENDDLDQATMIFKMMVEKDCLPTTTTYNRFIRYFSKHGNIKEGMELYMKLAQSGCSPDGLTYQSLIQMLCEKSSIELALQVHKDIETSGCELHLESFTVLINTLCKEGRLVDAFQLFERMVQRGISPELTTYKILSDCLDEEKQYEKTQNLWEMMRALNPYFRRRPPSSKSFIKADTKEPVKYIAASNIFEKKKNRRRHLSYIKEEVDGSDIVEAANRFTKTLITNALNGL